MFTRIPVISKILIGFAIAIVGIGYFLFKTYDDANKNIQETARVNYTIGLIASVEQLLFDLLYIENGNRGFVITNNESHLETFNSGKKKFEADLQALEKKIQNDPVKKNFVDSIKLLSNQKILFSEKVIELCKQEKSAEAVKLINLGEGQRIMDNLRDLGNRMEDHLRSDINKSAAIKEFSAAKTRKNFLVLASITLLALIIFYIIIVSDLRRSEKVRKELQSASMRIHDLYDNAPSGYISVDENLTIIQANKTALIWIGFNQEEVENKKNLMDVVHPKFHQRLKSLSESETISNLEIELAGNNITLDVMLNAVTVHDNKKPTEKRIVLTDISQRKKTEEEKLYLARLIDQTSDAIYSTDTNLRIRSWNRGAEKMYGFSVEEVINEDLSILRSSMTDEERKSIIAELTENGLWSGELLHHRKDGSAINVLTSVTTIKDDHNDINGYVSVVQDITTRKLYEAKLTNFNNELIEKVNIKTKEIVNILERVTDGFLSLDKDYKITFLNTVAANILGKDKEYLLGRDLTKTFDKEDNSIRMAYKKAFETQTRIEIEDYYKYLDKWFYGVMYPSPEGVSIFFRDITQRKKSEVKLTESEQQYRYLFEHNPVPMWVMDLATLMILDVNKAAINLYAYSKDEFTGKNLVDLLHEDEMQRFRDYTRKTDGNVEHAGVWKHNTKDGRTIQVEIIFYETQYTEKPSVLVISNDITSKIRYEEELKTSRDQLRQLSIHAEKVREEERAHIAREIHDELGQQLTGLKMDLSWFAKKMDIKIPDAKEKIAEMITLVDDTVKSIRKIASELRPGMLDDLGLNAAIDWQTHEFQKRSGISCIYRSNLKEQKFEKNISIGIFRILQEALTNVARHSNASRVSCDLLTDNHEIRLTISDNGKGIVADETKQKTLGLLGMKERALMMNGNLTIDSNNRGTVIKLVVPLNSSLS